MKTIQIFLLLFAFTFCTENSFSQNCSVLKNNSFTYTYSKEKVIVEFKDNTYTEYHQNKKHFIKSKIEWISDCEYYLTIQQIDLPDFPFKAGTKMHIKVTKVKGNKVYYTSSMNGRTWTGKMKKIEKLN